MFFGLIATGKSTLAQAWAKRQGMRYYNSDRVRKELTGMAPTAKQSTDYAEGIYSPDFTRRTYEALRALAHEAVTNGKAVVLDASYRERKERDALRLLAMDLGARLRFILCTCVEQEVQRRLQERALDPACISDGRWEIYLQQKKCFTAPEDDEKDIMVIDTNAAIAELLAVLAKAV